MFGFVGELKPIGNAAEQAARFAKTELRVFPARRK